MINFLDILQIISIIISIILGFVPSFISVKKGNTITDRGLLLILFFTISVLFALGTTVFKSVNDTWKFETAIKNSESAVKHVNENLTASNKLITITNSSLTDLKNFHNRYQLFQNKSDSIQHVSIALNEKLKNGILTQKELNQSANDLMNTMRLQLDDQNLNYRNKLSNTLVQLGLSHYNIYGGFDAVGKDTNKGNTGFKNMADSIAKAREMPLGIEKNDAALFDNYYKDRAEKLEKFNSSFIQLSDTLSTLIKVNAAFNKDSIVLLSGNPIKLVDGFKTFCERTLNLLNNEMANPVLFSDPSLQNNWLKYFNYIYVFNARLNIYGAKMITTDKVNELFKTEQDFLKKIAQSKDFISGKKNK